MTTTAWEVGDNMPLIYPGWVVPVSPEHWAPLHGRMFTLRGTPVETQQQDVDPWKRTPPRVAPEPGGTVDRLWKLYDRARVEVDAIARTRLEWEIFRIHVEEGPFLMGVVANWPRVTLAHKDLRNVPRREELPQGGWVNTWVHPTPAAYDPEAYYWENPDAHAGDA
jgi:peptide/nickel transport system substrate-binding protein